MFTIVFRIVIIAFCFVMMGAPSSFAQKQIPFLPGDDLQTIRRKIDQNGYSFRVRDYKRDFNKDFFVPGKHPNKQMDGSFAKTIPASRLKALSDLPEKFDWRNRDGRSFIGPVRDQGNLGSCYSFAACAAAESVFNINSNRYDANCIDFSESYVAWILGTSYGYSDHFGGGYGADYDYYELTALTRWGVGTGLEGVCLESDFPYQITEPDAEIMEEAEEYPLIQFDSWRRVFPLDYDDTTDLIKTAILTYGVVDAAVYVTSAFQSYADGVYEDTYTEPSASPYYYSPTNHAISLVGWDDNPPEGGGGCWILRNSWGGEWGEDGYMRIRYHSAIVNMAACYLAYNTQSIYSFTSNVLQSSPDSAVVSGNIKTNGQPLTYFFEYGADGNLDRKTPTRTISPTGSQTIHLVTDTIDGLDIGARYAYRLVVQLPGYPDGQNSDPGGDAGEDSYEGKTVSFDFKQPAIENAAPILNENYLLVKARARIESNNLPTSCWVEYGINGLFTQSTSVQTMNRNWECVVSLDNLQPDTEYSYRFAASNGIGGVVQGEERSFTTPPFIVFDSFEETGFDYFDIFDGDEGDWPEFEIEDISWSVEYYLNEEEIYGTSCYWGIFFNGISLPRIEPSLPFEGNRNLCFTFNRTYEYEESYEEELGLKGRIISPPLHLSQFSQAYLHFVYAAPSWDGANDEFRIFYKTQDDEEWMLIPEGEFLRGADSWTECTLQLQNLSGEYQIMFEATAQFGWGLAFDRVLITPERETSVASWNLY